MIKGDGTAATQQWYAYAQVHRNSDGKNSPLATDPDGSQDAYSTMLWDKSVTSYAFGIVNPNGALGDAEGETASY